MIWLCGRISTFGIAKIPEGRRQWNRIDMPIFAILKWEVRMQETLSDRNDKRHAYCPSSQKNTEKRGNHSSKLFTKQDASSRRHDNSIQIKDKQETTATSLEAIWSKIICFHKQLKKIEFRWQSSKTKTSWLWRRLLSTWCDERQICLSQDARLVETDSHINCNNQLHPSETNTVDIEHGATKDIGPSTIANLHGHGYMYKCTFEKIWLNSL